jgi:hypothetical protein
MVPEQPPTLSLDEEKPAVAYPKMVLHTQASLGIGHQITARFWQDLKPSDLHWTLSDFGWAKAAWGKVRGRRRRQGPGRVGEECSWSWSPADLVLQPPACRGRRGVLGPRCADRE